MFDYYFSSKKFLDYSTLALTSSFDLVKDENGLNSFVERKHEAY